MRKANALITTALVACFLVPVAALAADKNSAKVDIPTAVTLAGKNLSAGTYTFQWTDSGKINVLSGKKQVASVDGKVVDTGKKSDLNAVLLTSGQVTGIQLKDGRTLQFEGSSSQESAPGAARP